MPEANTISIDELSQDLFDAFKIQLPMFADIGTDLSSATAKKGDKITAQISKVPTVQSYDAAQGGYKNGAQASTTLAVDVPVTLDQHKHVPVSLTHLTAIASKRDQYKIAVANMAYALGKSILDFALGKVVAANFSQTTAKGIISTSSETLGHVRKSMNEVGASPSGRFGIVNSDFFEALDNDPRVASRDYYGQQTQGNALGRIPNIKGFQTVYEYPDLPDNGEFLSGYFADRTGIVVATRLPADSTEIARQAGIPSIASTQVVTDPDTGLSFLAIKWMEAGTLDCYVTYTLVYGAAAGSQGNGAGKICDYAGHRVTTQ